jgi:hypothetical protein
MCGGKNFRILEVLKTAGAIFPIGEWPGSFPHDKKFCHVTLFTRSFLLSSFTQIQDITLLRLSSTNLLCHLNTIF